MLKKAAILTRIIEAKKMPYRFGKLDVGPI